MDRICIEKEIETLHKATDFLCEAVQIHHNIEEKTQTVLDAQVPHEDKQQQLKLVADESIRAVKDWTIRVDTYAREESAWSLEETWRVMTPLQRVLNEEVEQIKAIIH